MDARIEGYHDADWLGYKQNGESIPTNLPPGLVLALQAERPGSSSNLADKSASLIRDQTAALQKLFADIHSTRTPELEERLPSTPTGIHGYRRCLELVGRDFAKMSLGDLILSSTHERLRGIQGLEYEYHVLVSDALASKLRLGNGTLVCSPHESLQYRQGFVKEIGPVSIQFVKDLLFAIKTFQKTEDGSPVQLNFPHTSWEAGALQALIDGLTDESISFGSLDISAVSSPDTSLSTTLLKLTQKPFATLVLAPGQMAPTDLEKVRESPLAMVSVPQEGIEISPF